MEQTNAPHAVHDRLLSQEALRWPGWQPNLDLGKDDDVLAEREEAEWRLADKIICGSDFVVAGIEERGGPTEKCYIVPYGVDLDHFHPSKNIRERDVDKMRLLFLGEVGLRKGAQRLIVALKALNAAKAEAEFCGRIALEPFLLNLTQQNIHFHGQIPRSKVRELMSRADLLVLPSLCEGSAMVIYEAVASRLPVLCSQSSGALKSSATEILASTEPEEIARHLSARVGQARPFISDPVRNLYGEDAYGSRLCAIANSTYPEEA